MKSIAMFTFLAVISVNSYSQIKHTYTNVITASPKSNATIQYNAWYKTIDSELIIHIQFFKNNPIGIKKAVELAEEICTKNGFDYESPDKDKSYLASFVKSMNDYENLNLSISTGGSIIEKSWYRINSNGKASLLSLTLNEDSYNVSVVNPK